MNDDLATLMTNLPEPAPPASLKATVMARIAREADREAPEAEAARPAASRRDWIVWLATLAGLVAVIAAVAAPWVSEGALPDLTSPRLGAVGISAIPDGPMQLVIGLGLLVYLAGLFGPLRHDARR